MTLIMTADSWMVLAGTLIRSAIAMTAFRARMQATWKRPKWNIGIRIDFGGGAGEGLAAMCGHQSGGQGMRIAMSAFSREIETVCGLSVRFPAHPPFIVNR